MRSLSKEEAEAVWKGTNVREFLRSLGARKGNTLRGKRTRDNDRGSS